MWFRKLVYVKAAKTRFGKAWQSYINCLTVLQNLVPQFFWGPDFYRFFSESGQLMRLQKMAI